MGDFFDQGESLADFMNRYKAKGITDKEKKRRPLTSLKKANFYLDKDRSPSESVPAWVKALEENLKQPRTAILGGNMKDIIFMGGYVATVLIQFKGSYYIQNLKNFIESANNLPEKIKDRLNYPEDPDDLYIQDFLQYTVIFSRIKTCMNSDLEDWRPGAANTAMKIHYFATAVYELTKVLRFINRKKLFLLDIKPANIFVCQNGNGQVFQFGDIDMALDCRSTKCSDDELERLNVGVVATPLFISKALMDGSWGPENFQRRDTFALMKSLLITLAQWSRPQNVSLGEIAKDALGMSLQTGITARAYQATATQMANVLQFWGGLGRFSKKERNEFLNGNTQKQVVTSMTGMVKEMLDVLYLTSYDKITIRQLDKKLKTIQTFAKDCGAKRFDADEIVSRVKRVVGGRRYRPMRTESLQVTVGQRQSLSNLKL
jgi:hypothetical protein